MRHDAPIDPGVVLPPGSSELEKLAAQAKAGRDAAVDLLGYERLAALDWNWSFVAREGQKPPPGAWRTWLILAGRGFGKTRAGAEWVRAHAEVDGRMRIALVAATLADGRQCRAPRAGLHRGDARDLCGLVRPARSRRRYRAAGGVRARGGDGTGAAAVAVAARAGAADRADRASRRGYARAARDRAAGGSIGGGREAAALLRECALSGLSFGYRVRAKRDGRHRELTDLDLIEVSLVTLPMQPAARVHAVEDQDEL